MYSQIQMPAGTAPDIITLNNIAVEYYRLGLKELSYQIWERLYAKVCRSMKKNGVLLPVISCNMGNRLRQAGCYEKAYQICRQALKHCFETGTIYAVPELILQLSMLRMNLGNAEKADAFYSSAVTMFFPGRQILLSQTIRSLMQHDLLLGCEAAR